MIPDPLQDYENVLATFKQVQAERDAAIRRAAQVEVLEELSSELARRVEQLREGIDDHPKNPGRMLAMAEAVQITNMKLRHAVERGQG